MRYLFESILVGIYSVIIYLFIQYFISSFTLSLLIVGFLKHYLGYYIGIHNLYCNYGDSSLKLHNNNTNYRYNSFDNAKVKNILNRKFLTSKWWRRYTDLDVKYFFVAVVKKNDKRFKYKNISL